MKRKLYIWWVRFVLNIWPCISRTGGRVTFISSDFTELKVKLALGWRTRNVVGTIYGGSMYASTDPFYMLMLMQILGKDYVVWDKGCTIRFRRPAKNTIYTTFKITPEMLETLLNQVKTQGETTFTWKIEYKDTAGITYAEFDKVLYVATKQFYKEKLKRREAAAAQN